MISKVFVSITIPVYNVQPFLQICLESVMSQTYQNWECILVDDGSNDGSETICDDYANKDSRFKVVHKKNGGLASARQCGIENAQGKYIIAIDADDWVDSDHVEKMVEAAESTNSDIVIFDFYINTEDSQKLQVCKPTSCNKQDLLCDTFLHKIHAGVVLKIISRHLFTDFDIKEAPCGYYEDMFTFVSCLHHARRISYCPIATYHYRQNNSSMTNDANRKKRYKMFEEAMINLELLSKIYDLRNDAEVYYSFCQNVNICRGDIITKFCISHPIEVYKKLKNHLTETCNLGTVKDKESLYMYLAVHWGILLPYQLRALKAKTIS